MMIYEGMVEESLSLYHNGISCVGGIRNGKRLVCYRYRINVVEYDDYGSGI